MVLERIKQFIDSKDIKVSRFEKSIGMANASFGKSLKSGGTIGADKLENILNTYPELSAEWLLRGEGEMLLSSTDSVNDIHTKYLERKVSDQEILIRELYQQIGMLEAKLNLARKGEIVGTADGSLSARAV